MIFNLQPIPPRPSVQFKNQPAFLPQWITAGLVSVLLLGATIFVHAAPQEQEDSWSSWGGNIHNTRSAPFERRISPNNVSRLKTKWVFTTSGDVSATPTVADDVVYAVDWGGYVYSINAKTGKAIWSSKVSGYTGNAASFSRTSPAIAGDKIIIGDQASSYVMALDRDTGTLLWKTLVDPLPAAFITNSPVVYGNRVYVGVSSEEESLASTDPSYVLKFRGTVQALDVNTGNVVWKTYTVPDGYTGGAVWGSNFVVDQKRGSLYVTTGNNYSNPPAVSTCIQNATNVQQQLACLSPVDYVDSVLSLNLANGNVKWSRRLEGFDTWTVSCLSNVSAGIPCPDPHGPDYDFGSGPNFLTVPVNGTPTDIVTASQKSGMTWGLSAETGSVIWGTQVGPGGLTGGTEWGSSTDGKLVYVPINNYYHTTYTLGAPSFQTWNGGSWAALDGATGKILWQIPATGINPVDPGYPAGALGPTSNANGVVYAGSMSGDMVAINAATGQILWKFASGGSVNCGPSIVNGNIYWGSGYSNDGHGTGNNKIFAFTVPEGR